jgi:asparagine synthase (glutamine-hydrolysing)
MLNEEFKNLYQILDESVSGCYSHHISLSGGLDSSIISFFLQSRKIDAISIIADGFSGTDLMYCQTIAKKFGFPLTLKMVNIEEIITAIDETIKILQVFNNIEIRNSVVMYLALNAIKKEGHKAIITGDGADELFAGYNFFLKISEAELEERLKRLWKTMHFPTQKIAKSLGINAESPFLHEKVIDFAKSLPVNYKVKVEHGQKYGKWILRKLFENKIPKSVVWRKKVAMQDGAGTSGLVNMFNNIISDEFFKEETKKIIDDDKVSIKSKESLYYYTKYRKYFDAPINLHSSEFKCPNCMYKIKPDSKFCRMCGSFPI